MVISASFLKKTILVRDWMHISGCPIGTGYTPLGKMEPFGCEMLARMMPSSSREWEWLAPIFLFVNLS